MVPPDVGTSPAGLNTYDPAEVGATTVFAAGGHAAAGEYATVCEEEK
jgi:hypothetical protein